MCEKELLIKEIELLNKAVIDLRALISFYKSHEAHDEGPVLLA